MSITPQLKIKIFSIIFLKGGLCKKIWEPLPQILKKASEGFESLLCRLQRRIHTALHLFVLCWISVCLCLFCEMFTLFPARKWNDQMLSDACRLVLDEIYIPPDAEGGMVEYRRTLIISLLFKFYLKVRRGLNKMVRTTSLGLWAPWPPGHEPAHEGPPWPGFNNTQSVSRVGPSSGASPPPTASSSPFLFLSLPHPPSLLS